MCSKMWFIDLDTVYYIDFLQIFTERKNQASDVLPFLQYPPATWMSIHLHF